MKLSIPLENVEHLQARFVELVKKADRLKLPAPQLILGEVYSVERKFDRQDGFMLAEPVLDFYQRVEVTGEGIDKPISYGTHHIVGVYNHEYERVMYNSFAPDTKPRPEYDARFRQKNVSHCDHCNRTLRRNNTYLIASEDGEQMLVGSSCMTSFIPLGKSVESIVAYYKSVFDTYLNDELFDEGYCVDPMRRFQSTAAFFARVVLVRTLTNVSPTDKEGMNNMIAQFASPAVVAEYATTEDVVAARQKAQEVIDWWVAREGDLGEFDYKLQTIAMSQYMRVRDERVAAWAVHSWFKASAPVIVEGANEFLGTEGERLNKIEVVLERAQFLYENDYGTTYLYVFKTPDGNTIVWKTSPRDLDEGTRLLISGRVKEHTEYNGVKQTVITRPTLGEIV